MKIKFDVKYRPQIESGEYKVITNDGHNVRIICWDKRTGGMDCIVALVSGEQEGEKTLHYTKEGYCTSSTDEFRKRDLFIITPEEELTDFEQEVSDIVEYCKKNGKIVADGYAKRHAKSLLSLAEKELSAKYSFSSDLNGFAYGQGYKAGMIDALKERSRNITANLLDSKITGIQHELIQFASNIMEAGWKDIIETSESYAQRIRAHVLKDIPRWKRIRDISDLDFVENDIKLDKVIICPDKEGWMYYIYRTDLFEKLPKEDKK